MSGNNIQTSPGARPAAPPPVAAPPKKEGRGLFGHIADVFIGGGEALLDVGKGLVTMVTHPIQTVKGIGYAVTHPAALYHAFVDPYTEAIAEGRPGKAIGRGIVEIGSLFITGGSSGAVSGGAKGAGAAAKLGQAAQATGKASKLSATAAKAAKAAEAASKAGKIAKAGKVAATVASKPIFTKAAAVAAKNAGITEKVAQVALKASHVAYWEARAAGKAGAVAKAAAAAKAAKIMGVSKNAAVVQKIVNGARLSGAAAQSAQMASKLTVAARIGKTAAAVRGIPTKVTSYMGKAAKAAPARLGAAVEKVGALTLKDIALAPLAATKGVLGGARKLIGSAWDNLPGRGAAAAGKAAETAGKAGRLAGAASKVGGLLKDAVLAPFRMAKGAAAGAYKAGKFIATHPRTYTPISAAGRVAAAGISALYGASGLNDEQVGQIAQQFNLEPSRANVEKFLKEIQTYQGNAIGPDSGSPEEVNQLQVILKALGYEVEPSGQFDEQTAQAVIDFKGQHGIEQSYQMADGTPGINEYVDENTAQAIMQALKGGESPADRPANPPGSPVGEGAATPAEPAAPGAPVYKTYTVAQMDRAAGLSGIARHYLGDSSRWKEIYDLNKDLIGDNPNLILVGQKLKMPADAKGLQVEKPAAAPAPAAPPAAAPALSADAERIAKQYGLVASNENVKAFIDEVNSYRNNAIGPDSGDKDDVLKLQRVLGALGYAAVKESGSFDDATAEAVLAFKQKSGLHQTYKLADGTWAINEYVDEATAKAMAGAIK